MPDVKRLLELFDNHVTKVSANNRDFMNSRRYDRMLDKLVLFMIYAQPFQDIKMIYNSYELGLITRGRRNWTFLTRCNNFTPCRPQGGGLKWRIGRLAAASLAEGTSPLAADPKSTVGLPPLSRRFAASRAPERSRSP